MKLLKRSIVSRALAVLVSATVVAPLLVAEPSTANAEVRVALVDLQRVLNETKAGKKARRDLESSSKKKQEKLDKKRRQLEAEASKLGQLSGDKLAQAQEKLQQDSMELQSMLYTLQTELAEQEQKLLEKIYANSQKLVSKMASERGFDVAIVRDPMTIIYTDDRLDITDDLIKRYNAKHKG
jgi:outer membrane protein